MEDSDSAEAVALAALVEESEENIEAEIPPVASAGALREQNTLVI